MKNVFAIASVLSENIQHTINELNHCKYPGPAATSIYLCPFSPVFFARFPPYSLPHSFCCNSFETGRIIPEVCCITKAAVKNVHFCTLLSKVAALVAASTCLFSCCNSSSVEKTVGNSVTKLMIESCLSTQRVAQIGFSFCRKEAEPETSLSTLS